MTHPRKPLTVAWDERIREPRVGIMLHYDASSSDASAVAWFTDPRCRASYNYLVLDSGNIIPIAPLHARAWHAGVCRTDDPVRLPYRDANSAFYGVAIAATTGEMATKDAKRSVAMICATLMRLEQWPTEHVWRITSHRAQAVYPTRLPDGRPHPKAGERGRKSDPEGPSLARPVMNTNEIRGLVASHSFG